MQGQFSKLGAAMAATRNNSPMQDRPDIYRKQMQAVSDLRGAFNEMALASNSFNVQTVQTISASQSFTNAIRQQKVGIAEASKQLRDYYKEQRNGGQSVLGQAIREQTALRNAMATQWTGNAFGKNNTDLYIPRGIGSELDDINTKYGMMNRLLYSAATNTVNWGKNTQWAGRQITVGLSVPLGMAAVGAGALALKVDQELTRVAKVYDTTATTAEGRERELSDVRNRGLEQATELAQEYGMAMEDTINIQSQLAAIGLSGNELFKSTKEVARFATLGDIDVQTATDSVIALQTAFRDTITDADDLADTLNYFNAVENGTSLGMGDIAEAIPRAASAMAALGVDAKETAVLLVAMKESGVDAAEAANALKSGATRILDPVPEAVAYFDDLNIDLKKMVDDAGGNMFDFLKELSIAMHGLDAQTAQTGISKLFGTYQFNRDTALVQNLGDAYAALAGDVSSAGTQTQKALELMGQSAEENAELADNEIAKIQESISGRFKRAIESVKSALVPLGMTALQIGSWILENLITPLLGFFNDMPDGLKKITLGLAILGAAAGPLLMLTGIFANLFGNVMKMGLQLGNLRMRFKAQTAEEAAAAIQARNMNSIWNTEAATTARLTTQIELLTRAMQENAIAAGQMMGANGQIANRTVTQAANGQFRYAAGSLNDEGKKIGGQQANAEDIRRFQALQTSATAIETSTTKTARNWGTIGRNVGLAAAGVTAFGFMAASSDSMNSSWMNIAMTVASLGSLFIGTGIGSKIAGLGRTLGNSLSGAFRTGTRQGGGMMDRLRVGAIRVGEAFKGGGIKEVGREIGTMAPRFAGFATSALRVFGPVGIMAGAAITVGIIASQLGEAEANARALVQAGQQWADIIGYDYNPGEVYDIGGEQPVDEQERAIQLANEMADANDDLREALSGVSSESEAYALAMERALGILTTGGDIEDARDNFEAMLRMMDLDETTIDDLVLRFGEVELSDPDHIRDQISENIFNIIDSLDGQDINLDAFGVRVSESLVAGIRAAGGDARLEADVFTPIIDQINRLQGDNFDELMENDRFADKMAELGIESADAFMEAYGSLQNKLDRGIDLTEAEGQFQSAISGENEAIVSNFVEDYDEIIEGIIQGLEDADRITAEQADAMRANIFSVLDLRDEITGGARPTMTISNATDSYARSLDNLAASGEEVSEETKLAILNYWRAKAGMDAAGSSADGFGDSTAGIAADANAAAGAVAGLDGAVRSLGDDFDTTGLTGEDWAGALQDQFSGTMNDVYAEADRLLGDQQQATIDSMQTVIDDRMEHYDDLISASDKYYDDAEDALGEHWDNVLKQNEDAQEAETEAAEAYWESQIEAIENAKDAYEDDADARIDALRDQIEAEKDADDERQKIFENEQRRIERMAARLNSNIDFNVALNSGDLDEAAKISNDISARESSWGLEDSNRAAGEASEARIDTLEGRIEEIEKEKDARTEAFDQQIEQTRQAKEAALDALKERQEAERAALEEQRKIDQDRLTSARETARLDLESHRDAERQQMEATIKSTQAGFEADKRSLAMRLRVLQEFVPQNEKELQEHIGRVESLYAEYGITLQDEGGQWGQFVGDALQTNVDRAAAALQNQINWRQIAENIAAQIGSGMGLTFGQVAEFLRTGQFPAGATNGPGAYVPHNPARGPISTLGNGTSVVSRHTGGYIGDTGGPSFSQRARTGVPRSSSLYPSEQMVLAQRGEFMVDREGTRKHRGLLETINNGGDPYANDVGGTGLMDYVTGTAAAGFMAAAQVAGMVAQRRLQQGYDEYQAAQAAGAGGSTGTLEAGNAPWQRLWNTIRRNFPEARLNDSLRPGASDYHGAGMAVDLGWNRAPGGMGNPYMASMNRWIYDNFRGSTELIYNGTGDDRPNLKNGADFAYSAALQAQHRNHVHWAMTPAAIAAAGVKLASGTLGAPAAGGSVQAQVQGEASRWGFADANNWNAINWVVGRESSWNPNAQNPVSTASGLFQHIDGTWNSYKKTGVQARKMRLASVADQAYAGMNYFKGRYGSPANAKAFWERNHWYDDGGYLMPGSTMAMNGTRSPEPVFTGPQWDILKANIGTHTFNVPGNAGVVPVRITDVNDNVASGSQNLYNVTVDLRGAYIKDEIDMVEAVEKAINKIESRNGRKRVIG